MQLLEKDEQKNFVAFCEVNNITCVHIPNGFYMGKMRNRFGYINSLKKQGFKNGFPDLIVLVQNKKHSELFLEFKKARGGVISPEQKKWLEWLNNNGYYARVARGCDDAIRILKEYLAQ